MQTKLYFFTKILMLGHALVASITIRLALGYHSVTTLNVTEGGHCKKIGSLSMRKPIFGII